LAQSDRPKQARIDRLRDQQWILLRKSRAGFSEGHDRTPYPPTGRGGVTPFAGGRASVVPDPERRHRPRRAGATHTDRARGGGDGGRRGGSHSAPRAPPGSGGDQTGYGATPGPDCGASSRPRDPTASDPPPASESESTRSDAIFIRPGVASAT